MPQFSYLPMLPSKPSPLPFVQEIQYGENERSIGVARWHVHAPAKGAVQILDIMVADGHGRRGHGSALMQQIFIQAQRYFAIQGVPLRQVWIMLGHKTNVVARAFLTRHGFHHVATTPALFRKEDGLIYVKSTD